MTQCERILKAISTLVGQNHDQTFTRSEIKRLIGGDRRYRANHIDPAIQGMRVDEPGGANNVGRKYRGSLVRVDYGVYKLTEKGWTLIQEAGFS